jgi:hypothetical protein
VDIPAMVRALIRARYRIGDVGTNGSCGIRLRLHASSGACNGSVIVTQAEHDGAEWIHASIARGQSIPHYRDLCVLKDAVFGPDRYAFQVFPPRSQHINIAAHALHLWGRADGASPLPEFGAGGTI